MGWGGVRVWAAREAGPPAVSSDTALAATENIIPVLDHSVALSIASAQSPVMRQASKRGYLSFYISPFGRKTGRLCPLFCEMCGFMEGPSGFGGRMPRGEGLAKKKGCGVRRFADLPLEFPKSRFP